MKNSFCTDLQKFMLIPTKFPLSHGMVCRLMPMRYGRHYGNEIMQDKRQK